MVFVRRRGWEGHEKVNFATLELGVGRNNDDLGNDAVLGGGRRWFLKDVFGVSLHDVAGFDGAGEFLDAAVGVHYADNVESSAWENAGDATPDAAPHAFFFFFFFCWCLNSHREKEREQKKNNKKECGGWIEKEGGEWRVERERLVLRWCAFKF